MRDFYRVWDIQGFLDGNCDNPLGLSQAATRARADLDGYQARVAGGGPAASDVGDPLHLLEQFQHFDLDCHSVAEL